MLKPFTPLLILALAACGRSEDASTTKDLVANLGPADTPTSYYRQVQDGDRTLIVRGTCPDVTTLTSSACQTDVVSLRLDALLLRLRHLNLRETTPLVERKEFLKEEFVTAFNREVRLTERQARATEQQNALSAHAAELRAQQASASLAVEQLTAQLAALDAHLAAQPNDARLVAERARIAADLVTSTTSLDAAVAAADAAQSAATRQARSLAEVTEALSDTTDKKNELADSLAKVEADTQALKAELAQIPATLEKLASGIAYRLLAAEDLFAADRPVVRRFPAIFAMPATPALGTYDNFVRGEILTVAEGTLTATGGQFGDAAVTAPLACDAGACKATVAGLEVGLTGVSATQLYLEAQAGSPVQAVYRKRRE